jgi:hypothetical protein
MAKIYVKKVNRENYLKHGVINKIKKAIKAHKDKKYILIKKIISKIDAQKCILRKGSSKLDQIQKNRLYDRCVYIWYNCPTNFLYFV